SKIDSLRLMKFNTYLRQAFDQDLFAEATAASSVKRGYGYKAQNVLDGNYDSYWAAPDSVHTGSVEITMNKKKKINAVKIKEYIPLGQRISDFTVQAFEDGQWVTVADGSTVGYQRIVRFDPVTTKKIRVNIKDALACPTINKISGYYIEGVDQFKKEYSNKV